MTADPTPVAVLLALASVSLAVLHWQFRRWPPYQWKQRLLRRLAELRDRRRDLIGLNADQVQARKDGLAADCLRRYLQTFGVDRLAEYPGIGAVLVIWVRDAGGRTLADLTDFPFGGIRGIGPVKAKALRQAVAALLKEARSTFNAGACAEAQEFRSRLTALEAEERTRAADRQRELTTIDAALHGTDELVALASEVTFWNYLFHRNTSGPSAEVMGRPLPAAAPVQPVPDAAPVPARPMPPATLIPRGTPAAARPAPEAVVLPPSRSGPAVPAAPPAPADLFQSELQKAAAPERSSAGDLAGQRLKQLEAYTRFAFVVAKADGRIARAEKKVIRTFLVDQFGHDAVLVRHIDPVMERTEAAVLAERDAVAEIQAQTTDAERRELYALAERVADASGERNPRERDLLTRVATAWELRPAVSPSPVAPPPEAPTPPVEPRVLLEIGPDVPLSADLIRRRYALLVDKLDPAKASALGPEFARLAEEKRVRLRAAAEALLTPLGEPLDRPAAPPPPADLRHNPDLDDVFGG